MRVVTLTTDFGNKDYFVSAIKAALLDEIKEINITSTNSGKKISVPFGSYEVVEVSHRSKNSNRINTFWLAPELDFIPVKLEQTEGNKVNFEANLVQLTR